MLATENTPGVFKVFHEGQIQRQRGGDGPRKGRRCPGADPPGGADADERIVIEVLLNAIQTIVTPDSPTRLSVPSSVAFETILSVVFEGVMTPKGSIQYAKSRKAASRRRVR